MSSSSQQYPNINAPSDPQTTTAAMAAEMMPAWYPIPSSLSYENPYISPMQSSTFEPYQSTVIDSTPLSAYNTRANPNFVPGYNLQPTHLPQVYHPTPSYQNFERRGSSPGLLGPSQGIQWPDNALGIHYNVSDPVQNFPILPQRQSHVEQQIQASYTTPSPPNPPQRFYPPLAPNPASLAAKRRRDEEEESAQISTGRRRKRNPSAPEILSDEDKLLLKLKEQDALPWKEIASEWERILGPSESIATHQMRYKRLRDRTRVWEPVDVEALRKAHEWYEQNKWDLISKKMLDFGVTDKWPRNYCDRKWQELASQEQQQQQQQQPVSVPTLSSRTTPLQSFATPYSSPSGGPHYG